MQSTAMHSVHSSAIRVPPLSLSSAQQMPSVVRQPMLTGHFEWTLLCACGHFCGTTITHTKLYHQTFACSCLLYGTSQSLPVCAGVQVLLVTCHDLQEHEKSSQAESTLVQCLAMQEHDFIQDLHWTLHTAG